MNYYEHHLGDYAEATAHLSFAEDAAYSRLLRKIYSTERALPEKKAAIYRLVGADRKTDQRAVDVVLAEFFELRDDGWHNARADREIARFQDKQRKAKASADARWAHRAEQSEGNANASAKDMRTHSEGNAPRARSSPQSPDTSQKKETAPPVLSAAVQSPAPASPSPAFDGLNDEELNGKAVVQLSPGFKLSEQWGLDAVALGWKPAEALNEAEKFRQYWTQGRGAGTRRSVKGWRQTWSNWLDKAAARKR